MVVYASEQARVIERLGFPPDRVVLTPYAVDTAYFDPERVEGGDKALVASAGLEFRDYPTLIEAVRGLDARVVIAAASHWSKRADTTAGADLPDNVEVCSLGYPELRQLYADASVVVVPLYEVPFQAGITTILEAMSMGKTVICSRTSGQTDVIVDGATGIYVPPGDPASLRTALDEYIGASAATDLGAAARRYCQHVADVRLYAKRLSSVVDDAVSRHQEMALPITTQDAHK
jgi:glycosyltransferase involved in cell wall biosynthesis